MSHSFTVHLETAWQAARAAGALIRENWQKPKEIGYKGAIDMVTSIDRESEHLIVDALRKSFPDHSILAEEETEIAGSENRYRWIVDPLDGTTNFAHGYPQFCVSIALERDGEIVLGLVYDPLSGECFTAVTGQGATLNGKLFTLRPLKSWTSHSWPPDFLTIIAKTRIFISRFSKRSPPAHRASAVVAPQRWISATSPAAGSMASGN